VIVFQIAAGGFFHTGSGGAVFLALGHPMLSLALENADHCPDAAEERLDPMATPLRNIFI
jgi:hypothetical protein